MDIFPQNHIPLMKRNAHYSKQNTIPIQGIHHVICSYVVPPVPQTPSTSITANEFAKQLKEYEEVNDDACMRFLKEFYEKLNRVTA